MLKLGSFFSCEELVHKQASRNIVCELTLARTRKLNAISPKPTAVKVNASTSISTTLTSSSSPFNLASSEVEVVLMKLGDCSSLR